MNRYHPPRDYDPHTDDPFARLEQILHRDGSWLEELTASFEPLTLERLDQINPELGERAARMAQSAIMWPDSKSGVPIASDSEIRRLCGPDAEEEFIAPITTMDSRAYNNFFLNLKMTYEPPSEKVFQEHSDSGKPNALLNLSYGTKPYVGRAHALLPEFMNALQEATWEIGDMTAWNKAMLIGYLEPEMNPDKAALLKGSRLAYVLLAQLMRSDDRRTQMAMLGIPTDDKTPITDVAAELRT